MNGNYYLYKVGLTFLLISFISASAYSKVHKNIRNNKSSFKNDSLKFEIQENGFDDNTLALYENLIINSNISINDERNYISNLSDSFGKKYTEGVLFFRNAEYKKSFTILISLLDTSPEYLPYYELLNRAAKLSGKLTELVQTVNNYPDDKNCCIVYLKAFLDYNKGHYQSALLKFKSALKNHPNSSYVLYWVSYSYRNLGDYNKAISALNIAKKSIKKNNPLYSKLTVAQGSIYYLSDDYSKAEKFFNKGLSEAVSTGNTTEEIKAMSNLAIIKDEFGEINKARNYYMAALDKSNSINSIESEAFISSELGVSYTYSDDLVKAKDKYFYSMELYKKIGDKNRIALLNNNIGNIQLRMFNFKGAFKSFTGGLKIAGDNKRTAALNLIGIADVYSNLSDYTNALKYYDMANKISREIKEISIEADVQLGLGILYYNLGEFQQSLGYLKNAEEINRKNNNPFKTIELNHKLGLVYLEIGEFDDSEKRFNRSAELAKDYNDVVSILSIKTDLAALLIKQKKFGTAEALLNKILIVSKKYERLHLIASQYNLLADIYLTEEKNKEAINLLIESKKLSSRIKDYNNLIEADYILARAYSAAGKNNDAVQMYENSVNLIDEFSTAMWRNSDIQINYFAAMYSIYNSYIDYCLANGNTVKAFELIHRSRGRNTFQNLIGIKTFNKDVPDRKLEKFYDAQWKLNYSGNSVVNSDSIKQLNNIVAQQYNDFGLAETTSGKKLMFMDFKKLQSGLENDESTITIYFGENSTHVFLLSGDSFKHLNLLISKAEIIKLVEAITPFYSEAFQGRESFYNQDLFAFNTEASNILFNKLLKEALKNIPKTNQIKFFVPQELSIVPLEFLVVEYDKSESPFNYSDKKYLINDYSISYSPSLNVYLNQKAERTENAKGILLVGDPKYEDAEIKMIYRGGLQTGDNSAARNILFQPLKYSRDEVESINKYFSNSKLLLAGRASEANFKSLAPQYSILHLSTHAVIYKDNPLIVLSGNADLKGDGLLETGEIIRLNLNSDLVVLSSCRSGLGAIDRAEGILGMQKAFYEAGTKSIIVTLWDIDDKYTAVFMKIFYKYLTGGMNKSEALRKAKIKFINNYSPNPYYWSAFILSGNTSSVKIERSDEINKLLMILFVLVIIVFYFSRMLIKRIKNKPSLV